MKSKRDFLKNKRLQLSIISIAFTITIFVCVLCNYAVNGELNWSLYPTGACVFVWVTLLPFFSFKKHGVLCSACMFTLLLIPFLALIEYLSPAQNWLIPLAIPISAASLIYLWAVALLIVKSRINNLYVGSLAVLLWIPLAIVLDYSITRFYHEPFNLGQAIVYIILILCISLVLFFLGRAKTKAMKKLKDKKMEERRRI